MTLSLRAGEAMLESSVAVADVDHAMRRLVNALGIPECTVTVTLNVITLSYLGPELDSPMTLVSAVEDNPPQIDHLVAIEDLIRRIERQEIGPTEAYDELIAIEQADEPYPPLVRLGAPLVSVAGWVIFVGGGVAAGLAAVTAWLVVGPAMQRVRRARVPDAFSTLGASFVVVVVPYGFDHLGLPLAVPAAVTGSLYPLLPGGLLVASVVDGLSGAPISSLAKGLQAAILAFAIAVGVLGALHVVDVLDIHPEAQPARWPMLITMLAAGVALVGLAVDRAVPRRFLLPLAGLGMSVYAVAWIGPQHDVGRDLSAFVAAVVLGAGGGLLARWQHTSGTVFTSIAVFALVPGIALYLAMFAFSQGFGDLGRTLIEQAVRISIAIAAGVALGAAVATQVPSPTRRTRLWRR